LRIVSGIYKGRTINPPKGFHARPTTDYARESLFNILGNRYNFSELDVLDLFAGTGSISYEFASREVNSIELVELNRVNYRFIISTIRDLGLSTIKSYNTDARIYLRKAGNRFDIAFADPPYDLPWLTDIPELVRESSVLKPGGILILEHPRHITFKGSVGFFEHRFYGSVNFSFFRFGTGS
jgi:16S rRNA (guanine966-N2)-methyltransferase